MKSLQQLSSPGPQPKVKRYFGETTIYLLVRLPASYLQSKSILHRYIESCG